MPDFSTQIRIDSSIKTKTPLLFNSSANFLAASFTETDWSAITLGGYQSNDWEVSLNVMSNNFLSKTNTESVFSAITVGAWQSQDWSSYLNISSSNMIMHKPSGVIDPLARVIVNIEDRKQVQENISRVDSHIQYQRSNLPSEEAYIDFENYIKIIDSMLLFSWRGTAGPNDYVYIEYTGETGWQDISNSLNYIVAEDGNDYVLPLFKWDGVSAVDEGEDITYDLVIAYDSKLNNVLATIEDIEDNQYQLLYDQRLATGLTYYWGIKAKDSYGGESLFSSVQSFFAYQFQPSFIQNINGTNRLLIPFSDFEYPWYTGNLADGVYRYAIYKYNTVSKTHTPIVPGASGGKAFIIDHTAPNPPYITETFYDQDKYILNFSLKLFDSQHRKYNVKAIQYANQRDKILNDGNFDFEAHDWINIPLSEIKGKKRNLESSPFIDNQAIMIWRYDGVKSLDKNYTYNLQIASDDQVIMQDFKYAYRNHFADNSPAEWREFDFEYQDTSHWSKVSQNLRQGDLEAYLSNGQYFGKANPNGIVMNKTRFDFETESGMSNIFDFVIYIEDIDSPLIEYFGITDPFLLIDPYEFYDSNITNVLVDLTNIENEYYELFPLEIEKIQDKLKNLDFYWRVQSNDGVDISSWSNARRSSAFNIHEFEWYVLTDNDFGSSDYYVLRAEVELVEDFSEYEFPKFEWLAKINNEINQLYVQINRLQNDTNKYSEIVQAQNNAYIKYLKNAVTLLRLKGFEFLVAQNAIDDPTSYYAANVHDKPVIENGTYTSDIDIKINDIISEKDIESSGQWSTALNKIRLDSSVDFNSQEGKPLREYDAKGRVCKNAAYTQCFLTTGDPNSCPWLGKLCPGFSVPPEVFDQDQSVTEPDGSTHVYNNFPREEWGNYFDPGDCRMQDGGPCHKYEITEFNMQEKTCEVCSEPRYLELMPVNNQGGYSTLNTYYSQTNPIGYKDVEIKNSSDNVDLAAIKWEPLISQGEIRQPKPAFMDFELLKFQLPGESNADILDTKNQKPFVNSYFESALAGSGNVYDMTVNMSGGWHIAPSGVDDKFNIVEII